MFVFLSRQQSERATNLDRDTVGIGRNDVLITVESSAGWVLSMRGLARCGTRLGPH